jgi:flagellar basal-body rod protein FlgF
VDVQSHIALSSQMALRRRLDVVASNIANVNTAGYKRENVVFNVAERSMPGVRGQGRHVAYVLDRGTAQDHRQGELIVTDNPLDVAVVGDAHIAVRTASGEVAYTRNGRLQILAGGELGLSSGETVVNDRGQSIVLDPDDTQVTIGRDGLVTTSDGERGRIALARFADDAKLAKLGNTLVTGDALPVEPDSVELRAGMIEGSNVSPIAETTQMIEILRAYQTMQKLTDRTNDIRGRAIERLGRVDN